MKVYDASFQRPSPEQVGAGNGIILYLAPINPQTAPKIPSQAEVAAYHSHSIEVGYVFESYETRATEGYQQGVDDGTIAVIQAHQFGHPTGRVVYVAADSSAEISGEYLRGIENCFNGHYAYGIYAGGNNLRIAQERGWRFLWKAKSSGWGDFAGAQLEQQMTSDLPGTDLNTVHGDWTGAGVTAGPVVTTTIEEEEMPILFRDARNGHIYRDSESLRKPVRVMTPPDVTAYVSAGYKKVNLSASEVISRLGK